MSAAPTPKNYIGQCHYCGKVGGTTRDHIVPASLGGPDSGWNIVRACPTCNYEKADSWPVCGCDQCSAAVERFMEDPALRGKSAYLVRRRLKEFEAQLRQIEVARQRVLVRQERFEGVLSILDPERVPEDS